MEYGDKLFIFYDGKGGSERVKKRTRFTKKLLLKLPLSQEILAEYFKEVKG